MTTARSLAAAGLSVGALLAAPLSAQGVSIEAYLKASNTGLGDNFGSSVGLSGDTLVVGADWEDSAAVGVDGDDTDDSLADSGAAFVFVRSGTDWIQQAYLKGSDTDVLDQFGVSVAVSGDTIVVGARGDDSAATTVNGDATDDSLADAGAAYVFVRNGTTWSQEAYLKASNSDAGDSFGYSAAIFQDTIVIGALYESGVAADPFDNSATKSGAAYVFTRSGTTWTQTAYLKAHNADPNDWFGNAVAIWDDTIVVGAVLESGGAVQVNGNDNDNKDDAGAAYVFRWDGTAWSQEAYLKASNSDKFDSFGRSVAVHEDTIVVGATGEDSAATGVNGDQQDDSQFSAGAAYVFRRAGSTWTQDAYLKSTKQNMGGFGWSSSVFADRVVVGAIGDSGSSPGVNPPPDMGSPGAGAGHLFVRNDGAWTPVGYLKGPAPDASDNIGWAVALSDHLLAVGAHREDSMAVGINGDPFDNGADDSGAVTVYELSGGPTFYCTPKVSSYGCTTAISTSNPALQPTSGAGGYAVVAGNVLSKKPGVVLASLAAAALPFDGGLLCVQPPTKRGPVIFSQGVNFSCTGSYSTPVNDGILIPAGLDAGPGNSAWYQYMYRDPTNPKGTLGVALSNGVQLDFQ